MLTQKAPPPGAQYGMSSFATLVCRSLKKNLSNSSCGNTKNFSNGSCEHTTPPPRSERSELVERFLREYNELSSLSRDVDRFSNDPSMLHLMVNLCEGKYNGEWEFRKADTDGANPSAPHAHAKNAAKKYADAKLNPYTGEICDSKGHSTGKFIYFDDYKKYGGKEDFADFVTESVNCTHDHPVYTNVDEIIKSVKAAIKQGRILTPAEWKQVRKIYR